MKPIIRRAALVISAAAVVSTVVQLPVATPTPPSLALTQAGSVTEVQITGRAGVPANASAVVLNLTALDSSTAGFVTAYACGSALPDVSNLNYTPGGTAIANSATVPVGTGGRVCLYTSSATNLIADINGFHPAGSSFTATTPTRLLDTRAAPAPATGQFVETFAGNTGLNRFDTGIFHRGDTADGPSAFPGAATWAGDHDMNCGSPGTQRTIRRAVKSESFYLCRDHLMTSIGDTSGYSTGWFEPKQTFSNVSRVSWDANITDLGGRQWWEVAIVPASFNSGVPTCPHCSVDAGYSPSPAGLPAHPAGSVVVGLRYTVHANGVDHDAAMHIPKGTFDPEGFASKAIRRPFSVTDNGNGTITVDWGGVRTSTVPGSFPAGDIKVVFKDHNYTPDKDGPVAGHTWHWDNIVVR